MLSIGGGHMLCVARIHQTCMNCITVLFLGQLSLRGAVCVCVCVFVGGGTSLGGSEPLINDLFLCTIFCRNGN